MATVSAAVWNDVLGHVKLSYPQLARGWFSQLAPAQFHGGVLGIRASNQAQVRYLQKCCQLALTEAAQAATGRLVTIEFYAEDSNREEPFRTPAFSLDDIEDIHLDSDSTFENFVTGPSNRLAHAAAVAVSQSPGTAYNPLFLHGSVGLGKTHLLQAVCHQARTENPDLRCCYLTCETFTNDFIAAVEQGALHQFRYRYRHVDLLMIDDVQFLAARERSQEEFFHTFNVLSQSHHQIVLSADCPPSKIPSLEERLVSRFNSGLVALMERPSLETRIAIIRKKAKLRCIDIPEEAIHLLATRVNTNIREIEGALVKIDALSQTESRPATLDLVRKALGTIPSREVAIPTIMNVIAHLMNVKISDLQSKKRSKPIAHPRQLCMYLARELTSQSLEQIGGYFGGRDHTTVLHACRTVAQRLDNEPQLEEFIQQARREVRDAIQ